jgi:hypothetical protein
MTGGESIPGFDYDPVGRDTDTTAMMAGGFVAGAAAGAALTYVATYEGTMAATALAAEGLAEVSGGMAITGAVAAGTANIVGKFAVSGQNLPGTTRFGNEAHDAIADLLENRLIALGVDERDITTRIKPGQNGADITIPDAEALRLGTKPNFEIKPNNASGERAFDRQLLKWGLDRSNTHAVTYDPDGTIYWGFTY